MCGEPQPVGNGRIRSRACSIAYIAKSPYEHGMRTVEKTSNHVHWYMLMDNRESPVGWQILHIKENTKAISVLQPSLRCGCVSMFWNFDGCNSHLIDYLPGNISIESKVSYRYRRNGLIDQCLSHCCKSFLRRFLSMYERALTDFDVKDLMSSTSALLARTGDLPQFERASKSE